MITLTQRRVAPALLGAALLTGMIACKSGSHAAAGDGKRYAETFISVRVAPDDPAPLKLAVSACQGLYNRRLGGSVYMQMEDHDDRWLTELGLQPTETLRAADFLNACVTEFPACVRYRYHDQQTLLPNVLTAAAALDAVPLDAGMKPACEAPAFDAVAEFAKNDTPLLATKVVAEKFLAQTSGLAMLNPGYEIWESDDFSNPALIGDMATHMVDFVFSEKLFTVFLVNGCTAGHPERALLQEIVTSGQWPTPIGVYGYNNSWGVAGFLHEAQVRCLEARSMGAIPTETQNLSFFSTRRAPVAGPAELERNPQEEIEYDPAMTYVAFIIGDGDNVRFIMTTRNVWLEYRLEDCARADNSCAPLSWSISPHLARIAPDVLQWYYRKTGQTGKDFFVLPPSGHLYTYPTSLNPEDQERFVAATERDARILGVRGTVHWDWFTTWREAEADFLPKYAHAGGVIQGVFPVNVPYLLPTFTWWPADQYHKVLVGEDGGRVAVFKPREWRGVEFTGGVTEDEAEFFKTPEAMAEELAGYPRGTVAYIYMTSDGGGGIKNTFMKLVKLLPDRVKLVSTDNAAKLALRAKR